MTNVTFKGQPLEVLGTFPQVGTKAPDFNLVSADLSPIKRSEYIGKKVLLNFFPSLDTPVCALSVRKFNQQANNEASVLCISADLPFAASRFCATEGLNNVKTASFFRSHEFTQSYGVKLTGILEGLCARAVLVLNAQSNIVYAELVNEITDEPNYDAALKALQNA